MPSSKKENRILRKSGCLKELNVKRNKLKVKKRKVRDIQMQRLCNFES